jgi:hypothetical protein
MKSIVLLGFVIIFIIFIKKGDMFCEKSGRYLYWIVCSHLSDITLR